MLSGRPESEIAAACEGRATLMRKPCLLYTSWQDEEGARRRSRLVRGQALLLPSHVEHSTRAESAAQQHGELYLAPELLRDCQAGGVLLLDGAAQAMLDALWLSLIHISIQLPAPSVSHG